MRNYILNELVYKETCEPMYSFYYILCTCLESVYYSLVQIGEMILTPLHKMHPAKISKR